MVPFATWTIWKIAIKKSAENCGNLGSGNWTRTSDIWINSPLFYRLNYARMLVYNIHIYFLFQVFFSTKSHFFRKRKKMALRFFLKLRFI